MPKRSALDEAARALAETEGGAGAPEAAAWEEGGALDASADLFLGQAIAPPARRPGRPKGAANRSTEDMRRFLAARGYRDPLEFLASIVSADPVQLARALGQRKEDAPVALEAVVDVVKLQVRAAESLAQYQHRRMPLEVEHSGAGAGGRPIIVIQMSGETVRAGAAGADGGGPVIDGEAMRRAFAKRLTDQGVADADAAPSHSVASHDGGKDE